MAQIKIELPGGVEAGTTLNELTKRAALLNRELKGLGVGTQEFSDKAGQLKDVNDSLATIRTQTKGVSEASAALKAQFGGILNQIPGFQQLSGAFNAASGGVGGLGSAFKGLIAIPIVAVISLIVAGITALTAAMKTDDETADEFGKVWAQISSLFDVIFRRIGMVGQALVSFMKGDFSGGFDKLKNSVSGVGDELERAWKLTGDLQDRQNELDDANNKFNATEQARKNIIDSIIVQSKDRTKTEEERIALETKGEQLLTQLTKDKMALTERQGAIDIETIGLKHNLQKQLNESTRAYGLRLLDNSQIGGEEAKKISDAIRKVDEAQGESIKMLERLQNQRNALLDKQEQRAEKERQAALKRQEELKKQLDDELKMWQKIDDQKIELMDEGREKDMAKLKSSLLRQIEELDKNSPAYAAAVASAQELARKQRDDINKKWDQKELEAAMKSDDLAFATEQNLLNQQFLQKQITEQQFLQQEGQLQEQFQSRRLAKIKQFFGEESKEYQTEYAKLLNIQKANSDSSVKVSNKLATDQAKALSAGLQVFGNLSGEMASMYQQGTNEWKAFATAQAILSTIQGGLNAYTSTLAIPIVGPALAPIAAGIALAAGYARVNQIQNTKVPAPVTKSTTLKAERGMLIGPSHADGGIPIEAEGGEIILTKGVGRNPQLAQFASAINVAAGGRQLAPISPFSLSSGEASSKVGSSSSGGGGSNADLKTAFMQFADKIDTWAKTITVQQNLQDVRRGLTKLDNLRSDANV